jgi:hypothetical protein
MATTSSDVTPDVLTRESGVDITATAFTETTADDTETLVIKPSKAGSRLILIINEVSGDSGTMKVNCAAGDYWAGQAMTEVEIAQGKSKAFCFEPAKHLDDDDEITVVITPATGKKVWTDHDATYQCFELPL